MKTNIRKKVHKTLRIDAEIWDLVVKCAADEDCTPNHLVNECCMVLLTPSERIKISEKAMAELSSAMASVLEFKNSVNSDAEKIEKVRDLVETETPRNQPQLEFDGQKPHISPQVPASLGEKSPLKAPLRVHRKRKLL